MGTYKLGLEVYLTVYLEERKICNFFKLDFGCSEKNSFYQAAIDIKCLTRIRPRIKGKYSLSIEKR